MIHGDETGQRMFEELKKRMDDLDLNDYERKFLDDMLYKGLKYRGMTAKQKGLVASIYDSHLA